MKTPAFLKAFQEAHPVIYDLATDVVLSLVVVAIVAAVLYAFAGTWPPIVSVEGTSMLPNMHQGDLVFLQGLSRVDVTTYQAANDTGYKMYSEPGDVIVYYPYGDTTQTPVIHRAMYWVNESEPIVPGGAPAPWSGYITLGDNNKGVYDQIAPSICWKQPVKKEWILGVAKFNVPYLGFIRSWMPF